MDKSWDEPWVIRKRGAFYRPEYIGYTSRIYEPASIRARTPSASIHRPEHHRASAG